MGVGGRFFCVTQSCATLAAYAGGPGSAESAKMGSMLPCYAGAAGVAGTQEAGGGGAKTAGVRHALPSTLNAAGDPQTLHPTLHFKP